MDHHRGPHPVGVADQGFKRRLPRRAFRSGIAVVQIGVPGVQQQLVEASVYLRPVRLPLRVRQGPIHPAQLVIVHQVRLRAVQLPVELGHRLASRAERSAEEIVDDLRNAFGFVEIPENAGRHVIAQSVRPPVVAGLGGQEASAFGVEVRDRFGQVGEIRTTGPAGQVAVPGVHTVVLADAQRRALGRPAAEEVVHGQPALDEGRGHADHHLRLDADLRRRGMVAVSVHADQLAARADGLSHVVGQRQRPVADAAHLGARFALAPAAAVAGVDRHAVGVGVLVKVLVGVLDDQLSQAGVADAELGVLVAALPLPVDQGKVFGMLSELLPFGRGDAAVGVPGIERHRSGGAIPAAPLAVGLFRVVPRAESVPDAAAVIVGRLFHIDRDAQVPDLGHDFPSLSGEKLAIAEAVQQIPDGVFDGQLGGPNDVQSLGVRAQQVPFPLQQSRLQPCVLPRE